MGNRSADCGDRETAVVNGIPAPAAASLPVSAGDSVVGSPTVSTTEVSFSPMVDRSDDEIFFEPLRGPSLDGAAPLDPSFEAAMTSRLATT